LLFGLHRLKEIRAQKADLHHFFNPDPFPFPYLRMLRAPVVYSVTCGVGEGRINRAFLSRMDAITVSDERSLGRLESRGLGNVFLVQPGIDTARFTQTPRSLRSEIRLMVGSAPWVRSQFKTKGVNALLEAARQLPRLHLIFLWRGVLSEEMDRRVHRMGIEDRVEVLDTVVDVNEILAGVHASVTLASEPDIVKAYPHSLLESLAAGKPVLVSRAIPMSSYVEEKGCGVVVERLSLRSLIAAVENLVTEYEALSGTTQQLDEQDFSRERMLLSFQRLYERVLV
jgi:glycosyltransferase involved in cell wall biosynthesis